MQKNQWIMILKIWIHGQYEYSSLASSSCRRVEYIDIVCLSSENSNSYYCMSQTIVVCCSKKGSWTLIFHWQNSTPNKISIQIIQIEWKPNSFNCLLEFQTCIVHIQFESL